MKNKRIFLSLLSVIIMMMIFGSFIIFVKSSVNFDELNRMTFDEYSLNEDLSLMPDGTYEGSYEIFPMSVNIYIDVKDHKIDNILIHRHSLFFNDDAIVIVNQIILSQSINLEFNEEQQSSEKILVLAIINGIEEKVLLESENI